MAIYLMLFKSFLLIIIRTLFFPIYELLKSNFNYDLYGNLGYALSTVGGGIFSISIAYPWKYINTVQVLSLDA